MKRIELRLSARDRKFLELFRRKGRHTSREVNRAHALLGMGSGKSEEAIADILGMCRTTLWAIRKEYLEGGLEEALREKFRSGQPRKYGTDQEAEVVALACSKPPKGRTRWTIEVLTRQVRELPQLARVSRETIRLMLKKTSANLGAK